MTQRLLLKTFSMTLISILVGSNTRAATMSGIQYTVEPILGYERAYKPTPNPHTVARLIYGVRAIAGYPILSGELEGTRATDSESQSTGAITAETSDKVKLGVRSGVQGNLGSAFFRAGGQAQRVQRDTTLFGVTTHTEDPVEIYPYAGAGAELGTGNFRLTAGATVVFRDLNAWTRNDLETTLGFKFGY